MTLFEYKFSTKDRIKIRTLLTFLVRLELIDWN